MKTGSKRGLFFTIDALIAALILISGLLLITSSYIAEQPRSMMNYYSQDLLGVLSELQVYEYNESSFVSELIANGSITDVNSTLLSQIGEFWAGGNMSIAEMFAMNISEGILPSIYGYSIVMDNDTVYTRSNSLRNSLITAKKIMTGIEKAKPIKGFIAKAHATNVHKTSNLVVSFSPSGAGWKGSTDDPGTVIVVKNFELPNVSVLSATAYLSLHLDRGSTDWNVAVINSGLCNITRDDMDLPAGSEGVFRKFSLPASCFVVGNNSIQLELKNTGYNAHIHPGTFFVISYNLTENPVILGWDHSERIYFDQINSTQGGGVSGSGAWVITPFYIPEDATNISVTIQVAGRNIKNHTGNCVGGNRFYGWGAWRCKRDYDYIIFLNSDTPFNYNATPSANPLYRYGPSQTGSRILNGTNVISVYFNNYEDDYWGINSELIYSDPLNNASGSSYVEVNYSSPPAFPYGVIEVRQVKEFGGIADPVKDSNFSFPVESEGVSSVFVHPVLQYSYITRVYSDTGYPPGNLIFESPSSRATPTAVYVPLSTIDPTPGVLNYERIQETSGNNVLPNSTIDYGFYIKAFVGYGQVFAVWDDAIDDAVARLQVVLGSYVNASDITIENSTMSGVPSLWGPALAEVRVWD